MTHCFTFLCKQVLASQGHIRDLVPKAGSVDPSANFKMKWAVAEQAKPRLDAIKQALQQAGINRLVLATDPDREGEAIAWHLSQVLTVTCHSAHTEVLSLHRTSLHVCLLDQSATQRLVAVLCCAVMRLHHCHLHHQLQNYRTGQLSAATCGAHMVDISSVWSAGRHRPLGRWCSPR